MDKAHKLLRDLDTAQARLERQKVAQEIQNKALEPIFRKKNGKPYKYVYIPLDIWNYLKNLLREPGKVEGVPVDEKIQIFGMKLVTHIDKDIAESGDTLFMSTIDFKDLTNAYE